MSRPLSLIGELLPLDIRQAATFGPFRCELRNPPDPATPNVPGSPLDLTGASFRAEIRKDALGSGEPAALLEVQVTDALQGLFELSATASVMNIECGESINDAASLYHWDLVMIDASDRVLPVCYGPVRIYRGVTKLP